MPRAISVFRRRNDLVDLSIRKRTNVIGFRFSVAQNFDDSFTAFQYVPNTGFKSTNITSFGTNGSTFKDQVRFKFKPSDYPTEFPDGLGEKPFYLSVEALDIDGVTYGDPEAPHLILPYNPSSRRPIIIGGDVTSTVTEIQLPSTCDDWQIRNTGDSSIFISFEQWPGSEFEVLPIDSINYLDLRSVKSSVTQLFVRTENTDTSTFTALFTLRNDSAVA